MSATVHPQTRHWVHLHRAALTIVILAMALAASLGLLATRLLTTSASTTTTPATSVTHTSPQPVDTSCQTARSRGHC